ncbi:MAG: hypothetical protein SGI96_16355 [Bacteroidota bacterium]|nr:hypothetical protein [Bacteroidota bacterium]
MSSDMQYKGPPDGGRDDIQGTEAGKEIIKIRLRLVINDTMAGKEKKRFR